MHKDRYLYVYIHIIIHFFVLYDYMTAVVVIYVVPEFIVIFEIGYHDLYYHWLNFIICTIIIHYQLVLVLFTGLLVIFKNSSDMFWRSKVEAKDMIWRCSRTSNSWSHQHPSSPSSNDKNPRNPSICMGRSGWRHKISVFKTSFHRGIVHPPKNPQRKFPQGFHINILQSVSAKFIGRSIWEDAVLKFGTLLRELRRRLSQ